MRGFDAGTHDSLLNASHFVATIEKRQGYKIACLEEIALRNKWISKEKLRVKIQHLSNSVYGKYLEEILEEL